MSLKNRRSNTINDAVYIDNKISIYPPDKSLIWDILNTGLSYV